jgi:hypothetical protein
MHRLILLLSLLPILAAMTARWWFGTRVLASVGKRGCRCDLNRWLPAPGDDSTVHHSSETAAFFGCELRHKALAAWLAEAPKAAGARENTRRFGAAVPPLATVVAAFALLVGKLPVLGVFAVLFGATALAAFMSLLSLPAELQAIAREARRCREAKSFPDPDDEQAVIDCAIAHAWNAAPPPILRWLQG